MILVKKNLSALPKCLKDTHKYNSFFKHCCRKSSFLLASYFHVKGAPLNKYRWTLYQNGITALKDEFVRIN